MLCFFFRISFSDYSVLLLIVKVIIYLNYHFVLYFMLIA